jgi:hypothetical protein
MHSLLIAVGIFVCLLLAAWLGGAAGSYRIAAASKA